MNKDKNKKDLLIIVDLQYDFCDKNGSLYVPGAENAVQGIWEFIKEHHKELERIVFSWDYHPTDHCSLASAWKTRAGEDVKPGTVITAKSIINGEFSYRYDAIQAEKILQYIQDLEQLGYNHTVWPDHCTTEEGRRLMIDHDELNTKYPKIIISNFYKGMQPIDESYSILNNASLDLESQEGLGTIIINSGFLLLENYNKIYVAGVAKDYCVYHTLRSLCVLPGVKERLVVVDKGTAAIDPDNPGVNAFYNSLRHV